MHDTMRQIANILQLRFIGDGSGYDIFDKNFHCRNIRSALQGLSPGKNDVVVFYYSGHGIRQSTDLSPLPTLACDDPDDPAAAEEPKLTLQDVVRSLAFKDSRLAIIIADTCNYPIQLPPEYRAAMLQAPVAQAYRRLFLESAGVIVIDSASPGEFSWYTADGGRFTTKLISLLDSPPVNSAGDASWDSFLRVAVEPIVIQVASPVMVPGVPTPVLQAGQSVLESPQALLRITEEPK